MRNLPFLNKDTVMVFYGHSQTALQGSYSEKLSRILFNYLVKDQPQLQLKYDHHRKPIIVGGSFHISISHSKDVVICAISDQPVGIDIEFKRPLPMKCFEFANVRYGKSFNITQLVHWCRLEAVLKLKGQRLGNFQPEHLELNNIKTEYLQIHHDYHCVLCYQGQPKTILIKEIMLKKAIDYANYQNVS